MVHPRGWKIKYVCTRCGSDDVLCDAYVEWDVVEQQWSLQNTFGRGAWCNACDDDTRLEALAISEEEYKTLCD